VRPNPHLSGLSIRAKQGGDELYTWTKFAKATGLDLDAAVIDGRAG